MTRRVRVPRRVAEHVLTSDAATRPGFDELGEQLVALLRETPARKDGSRHVELGAELAGVLFEYADALVESARDSVTGDASALADINAGRSAMHAVAGYMADPR